MSTALVGAADLLDSSEDDESWLEDMKNWTAPAHTLNQVDKAGDALVGRTDGGGWHFLVINNWRDAHNYPLAKMLMQLRRLARQVRLKNTYIKYEKPLVAHRIKRLASIKSKLDRESTMQLSQMQDIGGCRAVMRNLKEVRELVDVYQQGGVLHAYRGQKDYISNPKNDGYRSHHLIYQFRDEPKNGDTFNRLRVEIQIRTELQHAWATAVEAVGLFTSQALKSNIGSRDWLRLFVLMSSEIAALERTAPLPNTPTKRKERIQELTDLVRTLDAINTLRLARKTIDAAQGSHWAQARVHAYYLMSYSRRSKQVYVFPYVKVHSKEAYADYAKLESEFPEHDTVLVSVDSMLALQQAYPNYFLNTQRFEDILTTTLRGDYVAVV